MAGEAIEMTGQAPDSSAPEGLDSRQLRTVLGHYPTGVTVVTAIDSGGAPVGFTIGSFSSVSLDPPLVAFFPQRDSASFDRIRGAASFCVNILAEDQEALCRTFASKGGSKFAAARWNLSPSGAPVLDGSVAWLDCVMEQVWPAGDHFVVMGRVQHFSIERARMPLLFFQGGYGSFLSKSIVAPSSDRLRSLFKTVDVARASMETLSTQLGTGCLAISVVNDEIITLASTVRPDSHQVPAAVGQRVSWAPPLGALLVAWEGPDTVEHWLRRAKPPLNDGQRDQYLQALARVRSRGWSLALDSRAHREFEDAIAQAGDGADPDWRSGIEGLIGRLQPSYEPANLGSGTYRVRHIGAPVFDHRGKVVLGLHLFGLCDPLTVSQIEDLISAVVEAADSVTHKTGGRRPAEAAGNHVPISALSRDASDAITAQASGSPENGADA